jgi:Sortase family.
LFVGLLTVSLFASAGIAIAAPASVSSVRVVPLAAAIAPSVLPTPSVSPLTSPTLSSEKAAGALTNFRPTPSIAPAPPLSARPQIVAQAKTMVIAPKPTVVAKPTTAAHVGVYHLWIPALGLGRGISDWGCRGGLIPDRVEFWGCAGRNNLYLLGHEYGVFAKIHDAYHSGALHVGLIAFYADKSGRVHRYRVSQIRHVANAAYATWSGWATGATSGPVITLQTCDGATSAYRILVRLVRA